MRTTGRAASLSAVVALALGCGAAPVAAPPRDSLTISVPYTVDTLDPHARDLMGQLAIGAHVFDALVSRDADLHLRPALALRWYNPDPRTWVFVLRPNVRFHDGRAFTADDVVYTLQRLRTDATLEVGVYAGGVDTVVATDPHTVTLHTLAPSAVLLNRLAMVAIVPNGATTAELAAHPVGTGPYRFASWEQGGSLTLERNAAYWAGAPALARVVLRLGRGSAEARDDFASGRSDLVQIASRADEEALRSRSDTTLVRRTGVFLKYLGLDVRRDRTPYAAARPNPFRDLRVRQAVSLAIDRTRLQRELPVPVTAASQLVPPSIFGFEPGLSPLGFEPDLARQRLREAGLGGGFQVTLHSRKIVGQAAPLLREMLGAVGIRVQVVELDEPGFFRAIREPPTLFLTRYGCDSGDASDVLDAVIHSVDAGRHYGPSNAGGYANRTLDDDIEAAAEILDPKTRGAHLRGIMTRVMYELPIVPLYFDEDVYALRRGLTWTPRADSYVLASEVGVP